MTEEIYNAEHIVKTFGHGKNQVQAVKDVSFGLEKGQVTCIVGESGSGKSTVARMVLGLMPITSGKLIFQGKDVTNLKGRARTEYWRDVQAVFQDPFSAFNQFFTIRAQLKSSFKLFLRKPSREEMEARVDAALLAVNIEPKEIEGKYPFELSGGQMQRMLLARIFILRPEVLIADEPTSMVDACSRANILEYLMKLKEELDMTIVFVTHDIGLACYISNSIFIMHQGEIVEQGPPDRVISAPTSLVTKQLLEDIPDLHREWLRRSST